MFNSLSEMINHFKNNPKIEGILEYAYKDLSILMIAHRLDSIKSCDCIYYLENGKIVEFGSEAELMELHGKYFALKSVTKSSENTIDKQFK